MTSGRPITRAVRRREHRSDALLFDQAIGELGNYPDGRLRWLLEFTRRDLGSLSHEQWVQLRSQIRVIAERAGSVSGGASSLRSVVPNDDERNEIQEAQNAATACLKDLAQRQLHEYLLPRPGSVVFAVTENGLQMRFVGSLSATLAFAIYDLLVAAGAGRLRMCPYVAASRASDRCGKLFIAERRQRFCCLEHSRGAAWQAYLKRQGGTRAKR